MNRSGTSFLYIFVVFVCVIFAITGCGSSSTQLRVVQGSPFQSSVDVLINGSTVATSLAFGAATGYLSAGSTSPHMQIELSGSSNPIFDQTLKLSGSNSTFFIVTSSNDFTGFAVSDNNSAPSSGNANLRILNASPNLQIADVYVVQPPVAIGGVAPTMSGLNFQSATSYQSLAPATYEVVFAFPGTKIIAADSGPFALSAGQIRTVAGIATLGSGSTAFVLADLN